MGTRHWSEKIPFNVLLRLALSNYNQAIKKSVSNFEDLPPNAGFALASIDRNGTLQGDLIETLGASKQATGHLIDVLVERGYLTRSDDGASRRRHRLRLTVDGRMAAVSVRLTLKRKDQQLVKRIGAEFVFHTRVTLGSIIENAPGYNRLRYFRNDL